MIFKPKELKVFEDHDHLNITYNWFDGTAIIMVLASLFQLGFVFTFFLDGFKGVQGFLFPLVFIVGSIGVMYSALTKLFNKTIIDVYYGELNIVHKPIPWIKGNTKLNQEDIRQFYVKEKRGEQGMSYDLRARLKQGADISVLAIKATDSHLILQLEERLEQFMGIEDQPIAGEFGKTKEYYRQKANQPKRKRKTKTGFNLNYDLIDGAALSVKNKRLTVSQTTQYDWETGNSDKLFQLISKSGEENLLYVRKKGGLYASYVEHELNAVDRNRLKFDPNNPPNKLIMDGQQYILTALLGGNQFLSDDSKPIAVNQWIYTTTDNEVQIRVLKTGSILTIHKGKIIPDYYFTDPVADELELRDIEDSKEIQLEEEYREADNPWNEIF